MLNFCGTEYCLLDSANRLRLASRFVTGFLGKCGGEVVLLGLPEGCIGVFPENIYHEMRQRELGNIDSFAQSFISRRSLRRFGMLTQPEHISRQGRITLPPQLLSHAGLTSGATACIAGVEIGIEIWLPERLEAEISESNHYQQLKRQREMELELQ